ncbi:DegT/DnrJ/EryC1/StrS family aminotransferase, partial [Helicobacter pylori]
LYIVFAENRDHLLDYCIKKGIEAKVHYPIPIYRQKALTAYGYKEGDFPVTDAHTKKIITFPCDQHLSKEEMDYVVSIIKEFYSK